MDSDEFRAILSRSGVDVWGVIEAAIRVAGSDYGEELRRRRDGIVELLYAQLCRSCGGAIDDQENAFRNRGDNNINNNGIDDVENDKHNRLSNKKFETNELKRGSNFNEDYGSSPLTPESNNRNFSGGEEGEELAPYGGLFDDDEQTKILSIKEQLEDQNLSEDVVVELLQTLADMDITFQALTETDVGRHVNRLRKHPSNDVRILVKQLVRKWKETVDEWVHVNEQPQTASNLIADVDSPQQSMPKNQQNGHHQVSHSGYSPNPRSAERNHAEHDIKPKPSPSIPRREPASRPPQSIPKSALPPTINRAQREPVLDDERLNSARRRLQENYQEAQNAKKQRTIQVMDIHEIPKPKKAFIPKNKGSLQGRHHW
ncbi:probable mediator of RNA polymerase II transcription subunit 26c [Andrographis paniculata]|uniref:probable mediator of RNA polymerase II transcription subunit 26c n=1 Tax=Andrographis paniculata TaxID=175694 RepID=UPI0021E7730E|nr:probable mediator of RNA polymerase II transcription subunit 26c [Andrographis paniculata]